MGMVSDAKAIETSEKKKLRTRSVIRLGNVKVFCDHEGITSQKPDCTELYRK